MEGEQTEERVSALERRLALSREAIEQIRSDYGPNAGDLEKVVFALRSELGKVCIYLHKHTHIMHITRPWPAHPLRCRGY
jgi:hypothetical protein